MFVMKQGEILEHVRTSVVVTVVMVAAVIAWLVVGSSRKASEVRAAPAANAAYRPAAHGSNRQSGAEDPQLSFSTSIEVHATVPHGALTGVHTGSAVVSEVPPNFDGYLTPGRRP